VHAFDILGDPVRRRIVELLGDGEQAAGEIGAVIQREFGISQPAVSLHLRVLRENGFATVRASGARAAVRRRRRSAEAGRSVAPPYRHFWISGSTRLASRSRAASARDEDPKTPPTEKAAGHDDRHQHLPRARPELRRRTIPAGEARVAVFTRTYATTVEDLWMPARIRSGWRRWYVPVTGDLRVGGSSNR